MEGTYRDFYYEKRSKPNKPELVQGRLRITSITMLTYAKIASDPTKGTSSMHQRLHELKGKLEETESAGFEGYKGL
jgi:hypothetical protein